MIGEWFGRLMRKALAALVVDQAEVLAVLDPVTGDPVPVRKIPVRLARVDPADRINPAAASDARKASSTSWARARAADPETRDRVMAAISPRTGRRVWPKT